MIEMDEKPKPQSRLVNTGRTHFAKGKSGNPGGRPKGLAALVREKTKDGKELVEIHCKIMRGELKIIKERFAQSGESFQFEDVPTIKDRLMAAEWLADRGFGKAEASLTLQTPDGSSLISQSIIDAAAAIAKKL